MNADVFDLGHVVRCDTLLRPPTDDPTTRRHPPPRPPPPFHTSPIGLVDVTFVHPSTTSTAGEGGLHNVTLLVPWRERTALVGPVGSGKTTALRLLLGLHVPQRGDAYYDGCWFADWPSLQPVRRAIGYVPQQPLLFDRTILENVLCGHPTPSEPAVREQAIGLLRDAGFSEDRLHFRVGKGGMALSGGQRQLVWCARVFLQDPVVLILDEPTASMDTACADRLLDMLDRLMLGRTVLFVSHDPRLLNRASRQVELQSQKK